MQTGTVTLLFTDLVGSTELLQRLGEDEFDELRRAHFRILRATVSEFEGREVKNLGDGLMVSFDSALNAVACAIAIQQAVDRYNAGAPPHRLSIRVGLHLGEPFREQDDYFGQPVIVAKRLCDRAAGGQILASDLVRSVVGGRGKYRFRDLGSLSLKGIDTPLPAQEVVWAGPPGAQGVTERAPARISDRAAYRRGLMWFAAAGGLVVITVVAYVGTRSTPQAPTRSPPATSQQGAVEPAALTWERISTPALGGALDQAVLRLTATADGLVAVGYDTSSGEADGAVWTSPDGSEWERRQSRALGGPGAQMMYGVVEGPGGIVAVGQDTSGGDLDAAVWTSPDGEHWTRIAHDETLFGGPRDQLMSRIVRGPGGLFAVGYDQSFGDFDAAVWRSPDGMRWARVSSKSFRLPGDQQMKSVTPRGDRVLIAVGYDAAGGDADAAVWRSRAHEWRRLQLAETIVGGDGIQEMISVTLGPEGFVAAGRDESFGDADSAIWASKDGLRWKRVLHDAEVFGGVGHQTIQGIRGGSSGLVAVGSDGFGGGLDGAVWTSRDGKVWARVQSQVNEAIFGGDGIQNIKTVVITEQAIVAAGWITDPNGDFDAAIWLAPLPV
ncbi:MAG: adenylate/guanylate cyclase domain-containing protein [Actinomycetota bacterium]